MADYTVTKIGDVETTLGGGLRKVRAALGVHAFGMAVEEFPPGFSDYPEHDHAVDGQEEVYLALSGGGTMEVGGEAVPLDQETVIRVGPGTKRKVTAGPAGVRLLVLGGVPGAPYEPPAWTELGAPDGEGGS
jgi:mannose-6-phosphate isomerase-like protein (cupin superfamily)